jgi:hypothetical protein
MTKQFLNTVYDILVAKGGAVENDRFSFIYCHLEDNYPCREWRFCGKLGFGGKYRSGTNRVDAYAEDITADMRKTIDEINQKLSEL